MGLILHGSATTTEVVRRAIQNSQASLRELAGYPDFLREITETHIECLFVHFLLPGAMTGKSIGHGGSPLGDWAASMDSPCNRISASDTKRMA
jgi:hypothetical protein